MKRHRGCDAVSSKPFADRNEMGSATVVAFLIKASGRGMGLHNKQAICTIRKALKEPRNVW